MDKLVQGLDWFGFDHILIPSFPDHKLVNGLELSDLPHKSDAYGSKTVLNYISQMLMEDDDRENRPGLIQDSLALQAAEKSLYDVLYNPPSVCEKVDSPDGDFTRACSRSLTIVHSSASVDNIGDANLIADRNELGFSRVDANLNYAMQSNSKTFGSLSVSRGTVESESSVSSLQVLDPSKVSQASSQGIVILPKEENESYILEQNEKPPRVLLSDSEAEKNLGEHLICRSRGTRNHYDEDGDNLFSSPSMCSEEENNVREAVFKYINQMLMEDGDDGDDLENRQGLVRDTLALQAAEKSLYDVLYNPPSICDQNVDSPDGDFNRTCSCSPSVSSSASVNNTGDPNFIGDRNKLEFSRVDGNLDYAMQSNDSNPKTSGSLCISCGTVGSLVSSFQVLDPSKVIQAGSQVAVILPEEEHENYILEKNEKPPRVQSDSEAEKNLGENLMCQSRGTRNHYNEDGDHLEVGRSNKQLAGYDEDSDEQSGMYEVLLCPAMNPHLHKDESPARDVYEASSSGLGGKLQKNGKSKGSSGRKARFKKQGKRREVVDLMSLLSECAQAVAFDSVAANELLKQIRQHSSPTGSGTERMAHYLADALEARLAGTGRALDASFLSKRLTAAESLAAYLAYIKASPFRKMLNFFANKMIWKLAEKATRIHIIDFGIIHGFQWPGLFQHLSLRPGGPPSIRLTGIDFPQPGFRPAERVEETGRRLAYYCEKFNVPFEFNGVAEKWDTIRLEDLNVQRDEVLVVNCLNRMRYVSDDETVDAESPRDAVLKLIKKINPDLFIHGIVNASYNAPLFVSRFRELLFESDALFDMFDTILPLEHKGRKLYERDVIGRGAMSVVACEGTERIIRPETYRQWRIRNTRAGLKQLPLDLEIVEDVREKVKLGYHKDFVVDEDINWMLQGWKGKILSAVSCWKPAP